MTYYFVRALHHHIVYILYKLFMDTLILYLNYFEFEIKN